MSPRIFLIELRIVRDFAGNGFRVAIIGFQIFVQTKFYKVPGVIMSKLARNSIEDKV